MKRGACSQSLTLVAAALLAPGCYVLFDVDDARERENTAAACSDGVDNDSDGKIDCDDPDCQGLAQCPPGGRGNPCGNGVVDPDEQCDTAIPQGQVGACPTSCDDANTCTTDRLTGAGTCFAACVHDPRPDCCGNGRLDLNESCDDGNQRDFDGCSRSCVFERALVLTRMEILSGPEGCDLDGDGTPDNAFGGSADQAARDRISNYVSMNFGTCATVVSLLLFVGEDPRMMEPSRFSFQLGVDTTSPPEPINYFSGHEPFFVRSEGIDANGQPLLALDSMAPGGSLVTNRGNVTFFLPLCDSGPSIPIDIKMTTLNGTLTSTPVGVTGLSARLCGAPTARSIHHLPNNGGLGGATFLDLLVVGVNAIGLRVDPTQPDVDIDADGLEHFQDTDGDGNVDLCIDGNGTQIPGRDCADDPRIADAYSLAMDIEAVGSQLAGRAP